MSKYWFGGLSKRDDETRPFRRPLCFLWTPGEMTVEHPIPLLTPLAELTVAETPTHRLVLSYTDRREPPPPQPPPPFLNHRYCKQDGKRLSH